MSHTNGNACPTLPQLTDATLEYDNGMALLTFRRDDVRNALTGTTLIDDIVTSIEWANQCENVSVFVMTGEGKAFSAGGNVKEMKEKKGIFNGTPTEVQHKYRQAIQRIPLTMASAKMPVIAAINGAAIGAGLDLACMCDMRFASDNAVMGETFINLGLVPGDGGAHYLQRVIGYQKAAYLTFTGKVIKANEAQDIGLVLETYPADEMMERVREIAYTIAAKPKPAVRFTKSLLQHALEKNMALDPFLDLCGYYQGVCQNSEDHDKAVHAFLEKQLEKKRS